MTNAGASEEERPFFKQVIMDKIAGKNKAIHAYDGIIWKVRTGFLTLIFAGWGIVVSGLIRENVNLAQIQLFILMLILWFISAGLALAGFFIDGNYVQRKFRVIHDLNKILEILPQLRQKEIEGYVTQLGQYIRVSGDSGDTSYSRTPGYASAASVTLWIYFLPVGLLLVGLLVNGWLVLMHMPGRAFG